MFEGWARKVRDMPTYSALSPLMLDDGSEERICKGGAACK